MSYSSEVLADSPVGYWRLGETAALVETFTRANQTLNGTAADSGQTWEAYAGHNALNIVSNQAGPTTTNPSSSLIDSGISNGSWSVTVSTAGHQQMIHFRTVDSSNWWRWGISDGIYFLQKNVSGTVTNVATGALAISNGDTLAVTAVGSSIKCFKNGVLIASTTDSVHNTATKTGLNTYNTTTVRFDNLRASPVAVDETGAYNGAYVGSPTLAVAGALSLTSDPDTAAQFDGVDDSVMTGWAGVLGANPRTVEAWIKISSISVGLYPTIVAWGDGTSATGKRWVVRVDENTGALRVEVFGGFKYGTTALNDGEWHHVAVTFSGTNVTDAILYVDGVNDGTGASTAFAVNTTALHNVEIGYDRTIGTADRYFPGSIDEVAVYNTALSATRIQAHYNASFISDITGTIAQTAPAFTQSASGTVTDSPSGTYTGTINQTVAAFTQNASVITGPALTSYNQAVLADSPTAYWRMEETTGTAMDDIAGNNNGTYVGTVNMNAAGLSGSATSFPDLDSAYVAPAAAPLNLATPTSARTIECWVKTTDGNLPLVTLRDVANANPIYSLHIGHSGTGGLNTGRLAIIVQDNNGTRAEFRSSLVLNDGAWHHIAWTRNSSRQHRLVVDGVDHGIVMSDGMLAPVTGDLAGIGIERKWVQSGVFPESRVGLGTIDEVAIYNTALSVARIQAHYGASKTFTGTVAQTVPAFRQSVTGIFIPVISGTIGQTVAAFTQSVTGTFLGPRVGAIVQTVPAFTQSATGTSKAPPSGPIHQTLPAFTQSASGTTAVPVYTGTAFQTVAAFTQSASGVLGAALAGYPGEVMYDSPSGYWRFGETSGTVATDETGTKNGNYVGGPALGATGLLKGDVDTSVDLPPADSGYVAIGDTAGLSPTTALTLELWVNADSFPTTYPRIISKEQGTNPQGDSYRLFVDNSAASPVLNFQVKGSTNTTWHGGAFNTVLSPGTTYHIVATFDGTTLRCYVNGVQEATTYTYNGTIYDSAATIAVGRHSNTLGFYWDGKVDEFAIYNKALSASRVEAHYLAGAGVYTGTISQTVAAFDQSATGNVLPPPRVGTATQTVAAFAQDATGTFTPKQAGLHTGTADQTLPAFTQSATAGFVRLVSDWSDTASATTPTPSFVGTATSTLAAFTQAASGATAVPVFGGSVDQTVPAFTQSATGETTAPVYSGTATQSLPAFTQSATGNTAVPVFSGAIAQTVAAFTQEASGDTSVAPPIVGEVAQTLPAFMQSATGTFTLFFRGTAAQTLPGFTQSAAGTTEVPVYSGTVEQTVAAFTQDASGSTTPPVFSGTAESTVPAFEQTATGATTKPVFTGTAAQTTPAFTQSAAGTHTAPVYAGTIHTTVPAFTQKAFGTAPAFIGVIRQTVPAFTQQGTIEVVHYIQISASPLAPRWAATGVVETHSAEALAARLAAYPLVADLSVDPLDDRWASSTLQE